MLSFTGTTGRFAALGALLSGWIPSLLVTLMQLALLTRRLNHIGLAPWLSFTVNILLQVGFVIAVYRAAQALVAGASIDSVLSGGLVFWLAVQAVWSLALLLVPGGVVPGRFSGYRVPRHDARPAWELGEPAQPDARFGIPGAPLGPFERRF